jgi:hypothetical protein
MRIVDDRIGAASVLSPGTTPWLFTNYPGQAGGDSPKTVSIVSMVLAGNRGYRQGAENISITRAAGQEFTPTWDGNPDCAFKWLARNYGNNLDGATRIGAERAADLQARNSGTNLAWVNALLANARNDGNLTDLYAVKLICENYGNIFGTNKALIIQMLDENTTQGQERVALELQNIEQSNMPAVEAAIKISHTSTNGWDSLFRFAAASGDGYTDKITAVASLGNTLGYAKVLIAGTVVGRIPIFGEWA